MILFLGLALASTLAPLPDLEALAAASDAAVYGSVISLRPEQTHGTIHTIVTVRTDEGSLVAVHLEGGCVDGLCMTVPGVPRVAIGERLFVFLLNGQPTRSALGLFHVRHPEAWAEPAGFAIPGSGAPAIQAPVRALIEAAGSLLVNPPTE